MMEELKMIQAISIKSSKQIEFIDITHRVQEVVVKTGVKEGVCVIFVPHTTAGVTINENADPSVIQDIIMGLNKIVPFKDPYLHREGNSPAHIKSSLVGCTLNVMIESGRLSLGTWQGIFFCEFDGPRSRKVHVKVIPDGR